LAETDTRNSVRHDARSSPLSFLADRIVFARNSVDKVHVPKLFLFVDRIVSGPSETVVEHPLRPSPAADPPQPETNFAVDEKSLMQNTMNTTSGSIGRCNEDEDENGLKMKTR